MGGGTGVSVGGGTGVSVGSGVDVLGGGGGGGGGSVAVHVAVGVAEGVRVNQRRRVGVADLVGLGDGVGEEVPDGVTVGLGVTVPVGVGIGVSVGLAVGVGEGAMLGIAVAEGTVVGLAVWVGVTVDVGGLDPNSANPRGTPRKAPTASRSATMPPAMRSTAGRFHQVPATGRPAGVRMTRTDAADATSPLREASARRWAACPGASRLRILSILAGGVARAAPGVVNSTVSPG